MSSIVCQQGLQSCLEPRFVQPRTLLGIKLAAPKPLFLLQSLEWVAPAVVPSPTTTTTTTTTTTFDSIPNMEDDKNKINDDDDDDDYINSNVDHNGGGWDFIQALENSSKNYLIKEKETPSYVHPLVKRYSSKQLSEKSLELCTENLGCETGSDIGDHYSTDVYSNSSSDSEDGKSLTRDRPSFRRSLSTLLNKKKKLLQSSNGGGGGGGNLPPPLTSISGSNCVQVRPHREGGRLVIKTVVVPSSHSCFQAERRDGRLRLHFVKKSTCDHSNQAFEEEEKKTQNNEEEEEEEKGNETETKTEDEEEEEESESEAEEEDEPEMETEEEEEEDFFGEDMDGNNCNDEGEMGIENFQRPSRCKEGGRGKNGLLIWEPFWVAT